MNLDQNDNFEFSDSPSPEISEQQQRAIDETLALIEAEDIENHAGSEINPATLMKLRQDIESYKSDLNFNLDQSQRKLIFAAAEMHIPNEADIDALAEQDLKIESHPTPRKAGHSSLKYLSYFQAAALFCIGAGITILIQTGLSSQAGQFDPHEFTAMSFSPPVKEAWVRLPPEESWPYARESAFDSEFNLKLKPDFPLIKTTAQPKSSFPRRSGATAYQHLEQIIGSGSLPALRDIRIEDYLNHFQFELPNATSDLLIHSAILQCPWQTEHHLLLLKTIPEKIESHDHQFKIAWNPKYVYAHRLIGYENARLLSLPLSKGKKDYPKKNQQPQVVIYELNMQLDRANLTQSPFMTPSQFTSKTGDKIAGQISVGNQVSDIPLPIDINSNSETAFATAITEFGLRLRRSLPLTSPDLDNLIEHAEEAIDTSKKDMLISENEHAKRLKFLQLLKNTKSIVHQY